jgi:DNA-binding transcriptional LysR family regulator
MTISIDLVRLRSLIAVVDCGGFGRAATVLHISQPALSQHIRLLERDFDVKLFQKHGRGMRLTADGERVLVEARRLLIAHDEALDRLRGRRERVISVGSTEHAADQLLPGFFEALRLRFPDARTNFRVGRSDSLVDALEHGELDFAFVLNATERQIGAEVASVPLQWYAAPNWIRPANGQPVSLVAFEEPCGLRQRALAILSERFSEVNVVLQSNTLSGILTGARLGMGVALLPRIGNVPDELELRADLPGAGTAGIALLARQGLDPEIRELAIATGESFLVGSAPPRRALLSA